MWTFEGHCETLSLDVHEFYFLDPEGRECRLTSTPLHPNHTLSGPMRRLDGREAKALLLASIANRDSVGRRLKTEIWRDGYMGSLKEFIDREIDRFIPRYWVFQSKKPPFRIQPAVLPDEKEQEAEERVPTTHWVRFLVDVEDHGPLCDAPVRITLPDGTVMEERTDDSGYVELRDLIDRGRPKVEIVTGLRT